MTADIGGGSRLRGSDGSGGCNRSGLVNLIQNRGGGGPHVLVARVIGHGDINLERGIWKVAGVDAILGINRCGDGCRLIEVIEIDVRGTGDDRHAGEVCVVRRSLSRLLLGRSAPKRAFGGTAGGNGLLVRGHGFINVRIVGRSVRVRRGSAVGVIGCRVGDERHESRRVDRQLRGRAGRQGDPGSSQFFVSLEDDLMRLFGSDNIAGIMDKLGMEDDEPIEHSLVTKSIENAQKKVEARNFSIRKHVLEYDDVMNQQREVIYSQRHKILHQENLKDTIKEMVDETVERTMTMYAPPEVYSEDWDLQALINYAEDFYAPRGLLTVDYLQNLSREELAEYLQKVADDNYQAREDAIGPELMRELENLVMLKVVDNHWMEHLDAMDMLREGVGLRAYGQKDPLVEYKFEAYDMFEAMMEAIKEDVVRYIYRVNVITQPQVEDPLENASTNNPTPEGDEGNLKAEPKK